MTPGDLPDVPPSRTQPATHDFTLQAVIEMQRTLGEVGAKVDRLISDVGDQGKKVSDLREAMSFVKGAVWVIGILGLFVIPVGTWLLNRSFPPPPAVTSTAATGRGGADADSASNSSDRTSINAIDRSQQ